MTTPLDSVNDSLAARVAADQFPAQTINALTDPQVLDRLLGNEPQRTPGVNEPMTTNPALQRMIDGR